jgi:ribonuclease R
MAKPPPRGKSKRAMGRGRKSSSADREPPSLARFKAGAKPAGRQSRGSGLNTRAGVMPTADGGLPTRDQILEFVRTSQDKVGKREIARAFGIKGENRIALKQLLADMADDGVIAAGAKKLVRETGALPALAEYEIIARDDGGDLLCEPVLWDNAEGPRPRLRVVEDGPRVTDEGRSLGLGDRLLARAERIDTDGAPTLLAHPVKKLAREKRRLLGIYRVAKGKRGGDTAGGLITPIDRKDLREWQIAPGDEGQATDGDLVRYDLAKAGRFGTQQARVVEALGNPNDSRKISLIAIHAHGLPDEFPERVLAEVEELTSPTKAGRVDLTELSLVTIDPVDARDHDDAVHAIADADAGNPGGHIVTVAIADVAHYVRPGTRLDREAQLRGNSIYFPDRVVPMLPERISNDLCSLKEHQVRACLVVEMVFDASGRKRRHRFMRALMKSAAKLTYQQAQAAIDGAPDAKTAPLLEPVLRPLWAAYASLAKARDARGPLDLDIPERRIELDAEGRVAGIARPERLAAHRLIEEFMIQANVAAAEQLEDKKTPCVYRAHDQPSKEKIRSLRDFLETLKLPFPGAGAVAASHFNGVLAKAKDLPVPELVNEVVLRSQAQAEYTPENYGHFGLNLRRYAHFTSPIRRYADLLVHRALIRALKLGDDGLTEPEMDRLTDISRSISEAERRAMGAERETTDRLIAIHLAEKVGTDFPGRISGVTRSGLFVRLTDTGADGFVPISTLGAEYFTHDETSHALVGSRTGLAYRLGDKVDVRLVEAVPMAGALRFEMLSEGTKTHASLAKGHPSGRLPRRTFRR